MRRLLSSKAYAQAARAELGRGNLADVIPVCNVERKRARVSLGAIVSSYNKLKVRAPISLSASIAFADFADLLPSCRLATGVLLDAAAPG